MPAKKPFRILLVLFITSLIFGCQQTAPKKESLGEAKLEVTGAPEAIDHFDTGLLLLHSFEYEDARKAFQKAREIDPSMCMAYWGEAMTYNHPLWSQQEYDSATAVIDRLESECNPSTELESDLIESLNILYQVDTEKEVRDSLYAEYYEKLSKKYPENEDVKAFYSLSVLGSVAGGRDPVKYARAGRIAEEVVEKHPNHPGGLHYLIHAYDDPKNAEKALDAAYTYAEVAPAASHALHMPSHIFVAKGLWDEVVRSNEESYAASVDRMEMLNLTNDARGYHSYHWLEYGYLQQGRVEDAEKLVSDLVTYVDETPSKRARTHLVYLKGTFLAETMNYDSPVSDIKVEVEDLNISTKAKYYTSAGFDAFYSGNKDSINTLITLLEQECKIAELFLDTTDFKVCTTITRESPRRGDIDLAYVMIDQLKFLRERLSGKKDEAEKYIKSAMEKELEANYSYGPPAIQKPSTELYADWLRQQLRNEEALRYYRKTLERAPNRRWSVQAIEDLGTSVT